MHVSLTPELEKAVKAKVASGVLPINPAPCSRAWSRAAAEQGSRIKIRRPCAADRAGHF